MISLIHPLPHGRGSECCFLTGGTWIRGAEPSIPAMRSTAWKFPVPALRPRHIRHLQGRFSGLSRRAVSPGVLRPGNGDNSLSLTVARFSGLARPLP